MKRRSFLAMLGLAPVAGVAVAKGLMPLLAEAKAATARFRITAAAGSHGYLSSLGFEARETAASGYRSPGLFLDIPSDAMGPTRIMIEADKFRIRGVDGDGYVRIEEV